MTPTTEQLDHAKQAAAAFTDIAQLLKECVFPGSHAARVAVAIGYLERSAAAMVPVAKADDKRAKKALKLKKQLKAAPEGEATDGKAD